MLQRIGGIPAGLKKMLISARLQQDATPASMAYAFGSANARMAALLIQALKEFELSKTLDEENYSRLCISEATFVAIVEFNRLNALSNVPMSGYFSAVADALVTAYYTDISHPAIHKCVVVRHGLAWDVAKRETLGSRRIVHVPSEYRGQRFWVSHAGLLMAKIYTNTSMRHTPGASLAEFFCDWLM